MVEICCGGGYTVGDKCEATSSDYLYKGDCAEGAVFNRLSFTGEESISNCVCK